MSHYPNMPDLSQLDQALLIFFNDRAEGRQRRQRQGSAGITQQMIDCLSRLGFIAIILSFFWGGKWASKTKAAILDKTRPFY